MKRMMCRIDTWWIRVDSGPHMRTARRRRRIWRAARTAAEQARDDGRVEETQSFAEQTGRNGEEKEEEKDRTNSAVKTLCTQCCTCQATQTQQQQQQPQHPQDCDYNDPLDPRHGKSMACYLVYRGDAVPLDCLAATIMWISCQPVSLCAGSLNVSPTTCGMT